MAIKELVDLTVSDLMREYRRSFIDYRERLLFFSLSGF
jgi:hypothetical protein